jgi:hypothetical protein
LGIKKPLFAERGDIRRQKRKSFASAFSLITPGEKKESTRQKNLPLPQNLWVAGGKN